jgi:16S rRNA processing protein RimM
MVAVYGSDPARRLSGSRAGLLPPEPGAEPRPLKGLSGKIVPSGLIAKIRGCSDREAAAALKGSELALDRADLPEPEEDEFYLADLLRLEVRTVSGRELGRVERFLETGAGGVVLVIVDVMGRERMVPFSEEHVPEVDLAAGRLSVADSPGLLD